MSIPAEAAENLRTAYLQAARQGEVPLKLAYCGPLANAYLNLIGAGYEEEPSANFDLELSLLTDLPYQRPMVCIDVGVGSGVRASDLLREMHRRGIRVSRYIGLDISAPLLNATATRLAVRHPSIPVTTALWDFESGPTEIVHQRSGAADPVYFAAMLGLTLGNVQDPLAVLSNIRRSLPPDGWLMLGLGSPLSDHQRMLSPYQSFNFQRAAFAPLKWLGIDASDVTLELIYCDQSILGTFRVLRRIQIPASDMVFDSGTRITFFRSRRFTLTDVEQLARSSRWTLHSHALDEFGHLTVLLHDHGSLGESADSSGPSRR